MLRKLCKEKYLTYEPKIDHTTMGKVNVYKKYENFYCHVCYNTITYVLDCGHFFCKGCVDELNHKSSRTKKCYVCQKSLISEPIKLATSKIIQKFE